MRPCAHRCLVGSLFPCLSCSACSSWTYEKILCGQVSSSTGHRKEKHLLTHLRSGGMCRTRSKTPLPLPPAPDESADAIIQGQVGGSPHQPSPPPAETPTRLRACIKPMVRDTGLVQQAEHHRARLADGPYMESNLEPPSDTNAPVNAQHVLPSSDADSNIDPALLAESQMPAHALPSIAPRFSTPLQLPSGNVIKERAPEVMEPPLTVQLKIPIMRIIPPTPIDATSSLGAEDIVRTCQPSPGQSEPSTPTAGHRSAAINSILDEGYNSLEDILTQLVNKTALSLQQIMDGWHKSKGRIINGINHWNLYMKYIVKHEDQERRRLGLPADVFSMLINLFFHSLS